MSVRQKDLADILSRDPAVEYINSTVGAGGPNTTANYARLFIALKPRKEREAAQVVMARLRQKATQVPGMTILLIEQNVAESLALADFATVLENGEVALSGTAADVAGNDGVRRAYFGL